MTKPTGNPKGRPPGKEFPAKVLVSMTETQRDGLYAHAKRQGDSVSAVIRKLVDRALKRK